MKLNNAQIFPVIIFTFVFFQFAAAQQDEKWTKLQNSGAEFSILMPADFLVDKVSKNETEIHAFDNNAVLKIEIQKDGKPKNKLVLLRNFGTEKDVKTSSFKSGDFEGEIRTYVSEKSFSMTFYIAAPKVFYTLSAYAENDKNQSLIKFLNSIRLGKKPLVIQDKPLDTDSISGTEIESLSSSRAILEAINKKDGGKFIRENAAPDESKEEVKNLKFSRPLIVLRRPRPDSTSLDGADGNVRVKVQFRADGQIGEIRVVEKLSVGSEKTAVNAARKIKFLPAEIDGKAVDVNRVVVYNFRIF